MKNRFMFAVVALAGTCIAANGQVIISEVVDGPMTGGNPKYVEITNVSAASVTLGAGDSIRIYSNNNTASAALYDFGANDGANNVTLLPGQSWTLGSAGNGGGTQWTAAYGVNQPSVYVNAAFGNGNDVYTLDIGGVTADIFGVPLVATSSSDFSMAWVYQDSYARRKPNICAANPAFVIDEWILGGNNGLEVGAADNSGGVWTANTQANTTPNSHSNVCASGNDCNNNGRPDATDIALGSSLDCNGNALPDECDISSGSSRDCNANQVPDECEIAADPARDCNNNGLLDSCEIANNDCNSNGVLDACDISSGTSQDVNGNGRPDECDPFLFDCNGNGIEDATDISSNTSQDCNTNTIPDECELFDGRLTDANSNGTPDQCEGAYVAEANFNATVQPAPFGVRTAPNGTAFVNVEGSSLGTFASYAGLRFDLAPMAAQFDAAFGPGGWTIDSAHLYLQQSNAAFTFDGGVEVVWTNNDAQDFADNANPEVTFYENYLTDYTDAIQVTQYTFTRGADSPSNPGGNGTIESYVIAGISGNPGMMAVRDELLSGTGNLTLLLHETDATVAATYAGYSNNAWRGPSIVVFASSNGGGGCPVCAADFNEDGGVDGGDIESFFTAWEAGDTCGDTNQDGGVDGGDIETFFQLWEAGGC